jgi:ferredoxin
MFYNLFFSPTGGTKKVAEILGDAMHIEQTIDFTPASVKLDSLQLTENDICLISVPSFGGRIPFSATDKLKTLKADSAKAILVTTFGNRAIDDTLLEMKDILTQNGFSCIAAIEAVTEHSFVRKFGAGRPDAQDQAELIAFAEIIQKRIADPNTATVDVPGKRPYKDFKGVPFHPAADSSKCVSCGKCAKVCPAGAIPMNDPKTTDPDRCITCMACVTNCPESARNLTNEIFAALEAKLSAVCAEKKSNKLY